VDTVAGIWLRMLRQPRGRGRRPDPALAPATGVRRWRGSDGAGRRNWSAASRCRWWWPAGPPQRGVRRGAGVWPCRAARAAMPEGWNMTSFRRAGDAGQFGEPGRGVWEVVDDPGGEHGVGAGVGQGQVPDVGEQQCGLAFAGARAGGGQHFRGAGLVTTAICLGRFAPCQRFIGQTRGHARIQPPHLPRRRKP
jgi:hypothetical protein